MKSNKKLDKAQAVRNPGGLAQYVAVRYLGVPDDPDKRSEEDSQLINETKLGITDKRDAKIWNPVVGTGDQNNKQGVHRDYYKKLSSANKKRLKEKIESGRVYGVKKEDDQNDGGKKHWKLPSMDEFDTDPIAIATKIFAKKKGFEPDELRSGTEGANRRNELAQKLRRLFANIADHPDKDEREQEELEKAINSDGLAAAIAAAAGWLISDDVVRSGGGSPRGEMTPAQQREWERLIRTAMRRKSTDPAKIDELQGYWTDKANTYIKSKAINNSLLLKDHAPVPPRQGLVWDAVKHRWTNPKNVGKTVTEVQGKKRIRATGEGAHEHSVKVGQIGGRGEGSAERGRRFRDPLDISEKIDAKGLSAKNIKARVEKLKSHLLSEAKKAKASQKTKD